MNKWMIISVLFISSVASASEKPAEKPCALVTRAGEKAQIIPVHGAIETRLKVDQPIACGSSVITHEQEVWIRKSDQTLVRVGRDSFYELSVAGGAGDKLLRGKVMISGEHASAEAIEASHYFTPNAVVDFKMGTAYLTYSANDKETIAVCLAKTFIFKNRYQLDAQQILRTAEMSSLRVNDQRVMPTQPEIVSPTSVKENLSQFALSETEREEFGKTAEAAFEGRAKSLTADIENWKEISEGDASRSIASEGQADDAAEAKPAKKAAKKPIESIDPTEAKLTLEFLKKRLYGDPEELKLVDGESEDDGLIETPKKKARAPASVKRAKVTHSEPADEALSDPLYDQEKSRKNAEAKRVIREISGIH